MFTSVHRRHLKPWIYVLVAVQLLLAAPAMANPGGFAAASTSAMCDHIAAAVSAEQCPCCPAGAQSMRDCLAACTLAAAATPPVMVTVITPDPAQQVASVPMRVRLSFSNPPLKPPPIA
jgi:hypothetical protein